MSHRQLGGLMTDRRRRRKWTVKCQRKYWSCWQRTVKVDWPECTHLRDR